MRILVFSLSLTIIKDFDNFGHDLLEYGSALNQKYCVNHVPYLWHMNM
jgi:hypothetical protein